MRATSNRELRPLVFSSMGLAKVSGSRIRARLLIQFLSRLGARVTVVAPDIPRSIEECVCGFEPLSAEGVVDEQVAVAATHHKADVIYSITDGLAPQVYRASTEVGLPWVVDLHALSIVETIELGPRFFGGSFWRRVQEGLSRLRHLSRAAGITVANPTLVRFAHILNPNTILVPGIVDTQSFRPDGPVVRPAPADATHVVYAGNRHRWQGLSLFVDAARAVLKERDDYVFSLYCTDTDLPQSPAAESRIQTAHPERFVLRQAAAHDEMPARLRGADILVVPRPWTPSTYLAFPCKISEYMAVGRAILATDLAPHRFAIRDGENGMLCRPTGKALAAGMLRLASSSRRLELGMAARTDAESTFDASKSIQRVMHFLREDCRC